MDPLICGAVDDNYIATSNSTSTTENGAGHRIKLVKINRVDSIAITPYIFAPTDTVDAIDVDMENQMIAVRGGDRFYVYDTTTPNVAPDQHYRPGSSGGTGTSAIYLSQGLLAFLDDDQKCTILDVTTGTFTQPDRNPGRSDLLAALADDRFAFFVAETTDDSTSDGSQGRALSGTKSSVDDPLDPQGSFLNGLDESAGRVGFGETMGISDDGTYLFVAGDPSGGVSDMERLYVSVAGADFTAVADTSDTLNAQQAAGVAVGESLAAFLVPSESGGVTVAYVVLSSP